MNETTILLIWWVLIVLWWVLWFFWLRKWTNKATDDQLDKQVTDLMYEQHKLFFSLQWRLFDQKNVEETFFYAKRKFLLWLPTRENKVLFLEKWKEDILFLNWLNRQI